MSSGSGRSTRRAQVLWIPVSHFIRRLLLTSLACSVLLGGLLASAHGLDHVFDDGAATLRAHAAHHDHDHEHRHVHLPGQDHGQDHGHAAHAQAGRGQSPLHALLHPGGEGDDCRLQWLAGAGWLLGAQPGETPVLAAAPTQSGEASPQPRVERRRRPPSRAPPRLG